MTRGLTRQQIGVTEELIETFGDTIFRMSHNYQERRGDPYRERNWDEVERQRENMGLADAQIAEKIGLTRDQVLFIRTVLERRRFRSGHYARLLELGFGKRFHSERFTPHLDRFAFSEDALELRAAMSYPAELARKYVDNGWWAGDTLTTWLERHARERSAAPAIHLGELVVSYGELRAQTESLASAFHRLGLARGDVVAIQLPNVPEFLIAYLAIARLGAVTMTLHTPYRAAECETLLRHSRARAVICSTEALEHMPKLERVITLEELTETIETESVAELPPAPVASDPCLLLYTSGTTSSPKGVPLNYHNMLSNARLSAPEHGLTADGVHLSAAPFTHLYGLYSFHAALAVGASNLLLPSFKPPELVSSIESGRPTAMWTAPAHIGACMSAHLFDGRELSSLKLVILSGSVCLPALVEALAEKIPSASISQLWGMTELQAGLYTRPGDPLETAMRSAGRSSPGAEVRIAGSDGNEVLAPGEEGELQIRGCLLFPGYLRNDEANEAAFAEGGWFRSGDLAVRDEVGNVAITGRIKDIINRGGVKFNPRDVEELLDTHPKIRQSAIVPMPDDVLGERACLFATASSEVTLEELCEYLLEQGIAKNKLPEKLVIVDEMPMTPTRKIIRARLTRSR